MDGINSTYFHIIRHALDRVSDEFEDFNVVVKKRIRSNQMNATVMITVTTEDGSDVLLETVGKDSSTDEALRKALSSTVYKLIGGGVISLYESNYQD